MSYQYQHFELFVVRLAYYSEAPESHLITPAIGKANFQWSLSAVDPHQSGDTQRVWL